MILTEFAFDLVYSSLAFHYIENLERLFSTGLPRQCAQRALCILGAAILITQQLSAPAAVGILDEPSCEHSNNTDCDRSGGGPA